MARRRRKHLLLWAAAGWAAVVVAFVVAFGAAAVEGRVFGDPSDSTHRQLEDEHYNLNDYNHNYHYQQGDDEDPFRREELISITVIVLALIILTVVFEEMKLRLEEGASEASQIILSKLFGELTVLGFLAMVIALINANGVVSHASALMHVEEDEFLEYVESIHFTLFFVMCFFTIQVFVLMRAAATTERSWKKLDRSRLDSDMRPYDADWKPEMHQLAALQQLRRQRWYTKFIPQLMSHEAEWIHDRIVFYSLRHEFLLDRETEPPFKPTDERDRVDGDLPFGSYLSVAQGHTLKQVVNVETTTWLCFILLAILFLVLGLVSNENTIVLAWAWVGCGWLVFLFNIVFESHLNQVRESFLPGGVFESLHCAKQCPCPPLQQQTEPTNDFELLQDGGKGRQQVDMPLEEDARLPEWCRVDIDDYRYNRRGFLLNTLVGGIPSRQQVTFWMDRGGPYLFIVILQVNLIFTGVYAGLLLLAFVRIVLEEQSPAAFCAYLVSAIIPVLGITFNKRRLVATLTQVCSIGSYRKLQIIGDVLREEKTAAAVRAFLVIHKFHRSIVHISERYQQPQQQQQLGGNDRRFRRKSVRTMRMSVSNLSRQEQSEIAKTFDAIDTDHSGALSYQELRELLNSMSIPTSDDIFDDLVTLLDADGDGEVTKREFLSWYTSQIVTDATPVDVIATEIFQLFDPQQNGQITIDEFKKRLEAAYGRSFTFDELVGLANELDRDRSGTIDEQEFKMFFCKYFPEERVQASSWWLDSVRKMRRHLC